LGVLWSCGLAVELPAAPPAEEVSFGEVGGVLLGVEVPPGCGASFGGGVEAGVLSGAVEVGDCADGYGFVLLPPVGVCSLMGEELCDCGVESGDDVLVDGLGDCATTMPADRSARLAMYVSFFISSPYP
jgi:hypothetical protein